MTDPTGHSPDEPDPQLPRPRPPDLYNPDKHHHSSPQWHRHHLPLPIPNHHPHPPPSLPSLSKVLNPSPGPYSPTIGGSSAYGGRSYSASVEGGARVSEFLARLELDQYSKVFVQEGFDRIETLMDIQEEDLIALNVKRGHRRRLQRELAWLRGVPHSTPLNVYGASLTPEEGEEAPKAPQPAPPPPAPVQQINKNVFHLTGSRQSPSSFSGTQSHLVPHPNPPPNPPPSRLAGAPPATGAAVDSPRAEPRAASTSQTPTAAPSPLPGAGAGAGAGTGSGSQPNLAGTKRRYRRHPKPDPNAPVKPVSAFVTFSSNLRNEESLKEKSFAEMSVLVGERWQALPKSVKEALEGRASEAKETYASDMAAYKYSKECQEYDEYLRDFRVKNGHPDDPMPSNSHSRSTSVDNATAGRPVQRPGTDSPAVRVKRERSEDGMNGSDGVGAGARAGAEGGEREGGEAGWEEQAAAARVLSRVRPGVGAGGGAGAGSRRGSGAGQAA